MKSSVRIQLMVMMFLEFFVWGTWYATMGAYLGEIGFTGVENGAAYSTVNFGAILSPFIIGMIADRFFSAQKVLGIIHIFGAGLLWYVSTITDPTAFFWVLLMYAVIFMPTLALVNAISFYQMTSPEKEFPGVRVVGTISWIVAGIVISQLAFDKSANQFIVGAIASLVLGLYSFFLPDTPPKSKGSRPTVRDILGLDALALFKSRSFSIFILCSFLISIPLAFYFSLAGRFLADEGFAKVGSTLSLGQASEIIFMLLMPFFFVRLGVKKMLLIGMLAWAVRYVLFAYGNSEELVFMFYLGILLHGICYDFFFVTGQIYVDNTAPKEIQASAQGLISVITYGFGMLIGSLSSGWVADRFTGADGVLQWNNIWIVPAVMAVVSALAFTILFKDEKQVSSVPDAN